MRQSPVKCMHSTLGSAGKSLNVYAVYKMHVISQNSRRKTGAEDEKSTVLYCMLSTLQSAVRSQKKRCTLSRPKISKQSPIFLLQRYRSARQSPVQNGVLGLEKQLQLFRFLCINMAALSFFKMAS